MVVYIFSIGWDIGTVSLIGLSFETWADGLKGMGSSRVACHLDHIAEFPLPFMFVQRLSLVLLLVTRLVLLLPEGIINNSDLQGSITKP